jgi:hypothetical protein
MNTNSVAFEFQLQPSWELSGKNLSLARSRLPCHAHSPARGSGARVAAFYAFLNFSR